MEVAGKLWLWAVHRVRLLGCGQGGAPHWGRDARAVAVELLGGDRGSPIPSAAFAVSGWGQTADAHPQPGVGASHGLGCHSCAGGNGGSGLLALRGLMGPGGP